MEFYNPVDAVEYLKARVDFSDQVVFLDIDDTLLTHKFGAVCVVPYMLSFYRFLQSQNARIYIITARQYSQKNLQLTLQQLNDFGYTNFAGLFLMKLDADARATSQTISLFKSTIREAVLLVS